MSSDFEPQDPQTPEQPAANQDVMDGASPIAGSPDESHSGDEVSPRGARAEAASAAPNAASLQEQRAKLWHQNAAPILSIEAMRDWIQRCGLVLYTPRAQGMSAPAPSFVEATLGAANATPSPAESDAARSLLMRLIAEGSAVPLNLMGASGGLGTDVPDFLASAAVFSYIFTLRGNKAWKQAPETSGAVKVSPLALATYEMLSAKVTLSAYDLATQLGKEVTEAAVLRALTELWSQLRVLPVAQADGSATLWELATARFTKQIKAGSNAGQPSALSALISLYLGQSVLATEDDVESFLSPLAPRSRVRGVLRDLTQGRQLETVVIAGKTLLHVAGDLPEFAAASEQSSDPAEKAESGSRIAKFTGKPGAKLGTGMRAKPFARSSSGERESKPSFGKKPAFGRKPPFDRSADSPRDPNSAAPGGERERRPFDRPARPGGDKPFGRPSFNKPAGSRSRPAGGIDKPWNEDRPRRDFAASAEGDAPRPRRSFADREGAGRDDSAPRRTFSKPGTFGRKRDAEGSARPPRREFESPRPGSSRSSGRPDRSDRPGSFGGEAKRPFTPRPGFGSSRRGEDQPNRPFQASAGEGEAPRKVFRKFDAPRSKRPFDAERPQRRFNAPRDNESGSREARPSFPKRAGGFGSRPPGDARPERAPRREGGERGAGFASKRPGSFAGRSGGSEGRSDRPASSGPRKPGSFSARPKGAGGDRESAGRSGSGPKAGPFAKFADGKKPFRKPGKPSGGKPAGGSKPGGFKPVRRKRPEGGA